MKEKSKTYREGALRGTLTKMKKDRIESIKILLLNVIESGEPFRNPRVARGRRLYPKAQVKIALQELRREQTAH